MRRHLIDRGHGGAHSARARRFALIERIAAGEATHPKIRLLNRRRRSAADTARLLQFLRIARQQDT